MKFSETEEGQEIIESVLGLNVDEGSDKQMLSESIDKAFEAGRKSLAFEVADEIVTNNSATLGKFPEIAESVHFKLGQAAKEKEFNESFSESVKLFGLWHKAKVAYRTDVDDAINKAFEAGQESQKKYLTLKYDLGFEAGQAKHHDHHNGFESIVLCNVCYELGQAAKEKSPHPCNHGTIYYDEDEDCCKKCFVRGSQAKEKELKAAIEKIMKLMNLWGI